MNGALPATTFDRPANNAIKRTEYGWVLPERQNLIAVSHASSRCRRLSRPLGQKTNMDLIAQHLKEDYYRFHKEIPENMPFTGNLIGYEEVLKAHYLICDYFENSTGQGSVYGVKNFNLLGSALGRQLVSFGGRQKWTQFHEISATLFFGLVKNHAFHDGNKRTALLILIYQLYKYGRILDCNKKEFEKLTVDIASNSLSSYRGYSKKLADAEVKLIADFIRRKTREIDKRYYPLTYREFNRNLNRFNCYLDEPSGGYISVFKKEIVRKKYRFWLTKEITTKVFHIGFNGWKNQVRPKAVKEVLKATGLTAEHGIDSQIFYKSGDPMAYLIEEFEGPLLRLKDK